MKGTEDADLSRATLFSGALLAGRRRDSFLRGGGRGELDSQEGFSSLSPGRSHSGEFSGLPPHHPHPMASSLPHHDATMPGILGEDKVGLGS